MNQPHPSQSESGSATFPRRIQAILAGYVGILAIYFLDLRTGREISFSIFYLPPISFIAWECGLRWSIPAALVSGYLWYQADTAEGNVYSHWAIPIWNAIMRTVIFLTVSVIISKLRILIEREKEARQAATDATRAKADFLSNMSHEIRTPINAMIGAADVLAETEVSSEQAEYLEIFKTEGEQARRLLNDILDYSKLEAQRLQLENSPFSLRKLLASVCQSLELRCDQKGIILKWSVRNEVADMRQGDPYRLRQILTNLLTNSVKFTESGGVTLQAEPMEKGGFRIAVKDTGIGIPQEQQALIFSRYEQADVSIARRFGGSGLGLNISKKLIDAMGGNISFSSVAGQGTTFVVELPLPEARAEETDGGTKTEIIQADFPPPERTLRVLLVDDYEFNRRIIGRFLKTPALDLELAENGRAGLEKVMAGKFDLVLMDMHMPEMDGWTAVREIRKWEDSANQKPPLPIIALTASALKEDEDRCMSAGCTAFLGKPIRKKELLNKIEQVLRVSIQTPATMAAHDDHPEIDPEIALLIPGVLDESLRRCEAAIQAAGLNQLSVAAEIAHQLIGLGGTYGFGKITDVARRIERHALQNKAEEVACLSGELKSYIYGLKKAYE